MRRESGLPFTSRPESWIRPGYAGRRTAWARYLGAQEYVASAEEAARRVGRKYDLGAATVTDYNAAVTTRVKARSQLLQAKYEYLFKCRILEYYAAR